jgi:hypothetical protein
MAVATWFSVAAPDWKESIKKENGLIEELRQDIEIFVNPQGRPRD